MQPDNQKEGIIKKHLLRESAINLLRTRKEQIRQQMLIKTILNKRHKFKSFVYQHVIMTQYCGEEIIEVTVDPRKNSEAISSECDTTGSRCGWLPKPA